MGVLTLFGPTWAGSARAVGPIWVDILTRSPIENKSPDTGSPTVSQEIGERADQSPVVLVRVGDDHADQRRVGLHEAGDRRQRDIVAPFGGERPADVEDEAGAVGLDLDAAAANLMGAAVDADPH
jgi:hypothetical protein